MMEDYALDDYIKDQKKKPKTSEKMEFTSKDLGDMPEAKSSVSYSLTSKDGFGLIFTIRSSDEQELLKNMVAIEAKLIKMGYKPEVKRSYGGSKPKEIVQGIKCPTCGADLVKFETKTGKSGIQCSTRRYDGATKTTSGCNYIKWNDDNSSTGGVGGATEAQISLLKEKMLWVEGMTKVEASKKISAVLGK